MASDKKTNNSNTDDEIAEIMSEIQSLQASMAAPAAAEAVKAPATSRKLGADAVTAEDLSAVNLDSLADELSEFRGANDEPSMEETLAGMKDDEPVSKPSLLDASSVEEEAHHRPQDDVDSLIEAEMAAEAGRGTRHVEAEANFDTGEGLMPEFGSSSAEKNEGSLSMMIAGNMTLKLKYEFGGQEVTLSFSDNALKVTLLDGTEFKIPVGRARLKAA